MDEVILFLVAFILVMAVPYWIIVTMVERDKLLRQIAIRRERVKEVLKQVAFRANNLLVHERTGTIVHKPKEAEDRVKALQVEADRIRASIFKRWPSERFLAKKDERLRLVYFEDRFFRAWWKLIYFLSDLFSFPLLLAPWNRAKILEERLSLWEEAYARYVELVEELRGFEQASLLQTKEKVEEESSRRKAEKAKEAQEALLAEAAALRGRIEKAVWSNRSKLLYLAGSVFLDVDQAETAWLKELAEANQEPEALVRVEKLQALTAFFEPGQDNKSWILATAESLVQTEKELRGLKDNLTEAGEKMGQKPQKPPALIRAERLVKVAFRFLYRLNLAAIQNTTEQLGTLKNLAAIRINDLGSLVGVIFSLKENVGWILKMENVLKAHGVPTESLESLDQVTALLEKRAPKYWKEGDEKGVSDILKQVREALNLRVISMATRVDEKAKQVSMDPDTPDEAVKKLRELQEKLLRGPEDDGKQVRVVQSSQRQTVALSGQVTRSELGTLMPAEYRDTWEGTDARKKQNGEEHTRR